MNGYRRRRIVMPIGLAAFCGGVCFGFPACGGSPAAPTGTSTSATIESVVTTFRGALVESNPVIIESPEVLDVDVKFALGMPAGSIVTLYLCAMETASSIGAGTCIALSDTVANLQARGNVVRMGISTFKTDGVPRTTHYVYVGLTEGAIPWHFTGASPPRVGDMFGNNRVLATLQVARTVTFR